MTARQPPSARLAAGVTIVCAVGAALVVIATSSNDQPPRNAEPSGLMAPVAAGNSAANVPLDGAVKRLLVRWVARSSGTLTALHLRIQANGASCRLDGKTGYGLGDGGSWVVTTHPVLADGRPDTAKTLSRERLTPCEGPLDEVDVRQGIVRVAMRLPVERGTEYATVIRNGDPSPARNYSSGNFLYTNTGIIGANGRNERDRNARDAYYGLDPRELVGYSRDAGRTWSLPGGPYGTGGGRNFLPTYLQEYADGQLVGQPHYYAIAPTNTPRTITYANIHRPWTIRELGAYTPTRSDGTITLAVDGRTTATAHLEGSGMLRHAIRPTTVNPGHTVTVTASGLTLQDIVADTAWGRLTGMNLETRTSRIEGQADFSRAVPVYPLPPPPPPSAPPAG